MRKENRNEKKNKEIERLNEIALEKKRFFISLYRDIILVMIRELIQRLIG